MDGWGLGFGGFGGNGDGVLQKGGGKEELGSGLHGHGWRWSYAGLDITSNEMRIYRSYHGWLVRKKLGLQGSNIMFYIKPVSQCYIVNPLILTKLSSLRLSGTLSV